MLVLQAVPGASPIGGADQLLSKALKQSLEGGEAEAGVGLTGLLEGAAEDEVVAGSLTFRLDRSWSCARLPELTHVRQSVDCCTLCHE